MTDQEAKPKRRLAAIMATDVVGYSKLMQSDEALALAALAAIRKATQEHIELHQGRIANTAGDSVLAEFGSAVEAVDCAMALQQQLSSRTEDEDVQVRIGIHLGDVVDKGGDLFGTAVNVAARLEAIAQPGSIVVSVAVRDAIAGKLPASFTDLGMKPLKNIEEPVWAFTLAPRTRYISPGVVRTGEGLPLPSKPSIAVLPFDDLSGGHDQEYFADGMVEEIITALSRFRGLFVIARNSSFTYKGRPVDVKQVGRELGVRYVLEGSVRKAGSRVRITGQLIDASNGAHLWADRFDGSLEDVFDLQDQVTTSVVGAIAPRLEQAEIERAKRKATDSLDAYDFYLRGLSTIHQGSREASDAAVRMFHLAIEHDPDFSPAYAMAARCYMLRKANGWMVNRAEESAEAIRLARRGVELGRDDATTLCFSALAVGYVLGDVREGAELVGRALALNSNLAAAWYVSSWIKTCQGELDTAIGHAARAMRLSPLEPATYLWQSITALAHFCAGRYSDAVWWAETALSEQAAFTFALRILSASYALAGRPIEAQMAMTKLRQADPQLRMSNLGDVVSPLRPEHLAKYIEGLRLAGLPE